MPGGGQFWKYLINRVSTKYGYSHDHGCKRGIFLGSMTRLKNRRPSLKSVQCARFKLASQIKKLTSIATALFSIAVSVHADSWGGAFSLGPSTASIIHPPLPGPAPDPQLGKLFVWPGINNGTGDLIQKKTERHANEGKRRNCVAEKPAEPNTRAENTEITCEAPKVLFLEPAGGGARSERSTDYFIGISWASWVLAGGSLSSATAGATHGVSCGRRSKDFLQSHEVNLNIFHHIPCGT
ncbi:hypothetical protein FB451DRAFT_1173254 [Mycena latifolia]|nr:hypothetical protein FB451DRAFT_1173254 [Mycena latifolia]